MTVTVGHITEAGRTLGPFPDADSAHWPPRVSRFDPAYWALSLTADFVLDRDRVLVIEADVEEAD